MTQPLAMKQVQEQLLRYQSDLQHIPVSDRDTVDQQFFAIGKKLLSLFPQFTSSDLPTLTQLLASWYTLVLQRLHTEAVSGNQELAYAYVLHLLEQPPLTVQEMKEQVPLAINGIIASYRTKDWHRLLSGLGRVRGGIGEGGDE
ncbi:MAG: hypothetical protein QY312_03265 [Candidatus Dojkabacteria bacterium]|nr:MAG: hypothetical protein QY312_03265 [Candidatus Dojkabacteria bacterium]